MTEKLTKEAVARIIDPDEWASVDRQATTRKGRVVTITDAVKERVCKRSLAKADEIIAYVLALSQPQIGLLSARDTSSSDDAVRPSAHDGVDPELLFWAFRYALGRSTYSVQDVAGAIIKHANQLAPLYRVQMVDEITAAIDRGQAGMAMDVKQWAEVRDVLSGLPTPPAPDEGSRAQDKPSSDDAATGPAASAGQGWAAALVRAAQICEQQAAEFLSPQYAVGQPLSSLSERFACKECADAIRLAALESPTP